MIQHINGETPFPIYVSLVIQARTWSREFIDNLHSCGMCIGNNILLTISTQLANRVSNDSATIKPWYVLHTSSQGSYRRGQWITSITTKAPDHRKTVSMGRPGWTVDSHCLYSVNVANHSQKFTHSSFTVAGQSHSRSWSCSLIDF